MQYLFVKDKRPQDFPGPITGQLPGGEFIRHIGQIGASEMEETIRRRRIDALRIEELTLRATEALAAVENHDKLTGPFSSAKGRGRPRKNNIHSSGKATDKWGI